MDISEIYGKIFPIEIDDNNVYAELKGDELNCAQLCEPTISVNEIVIPKSQRGNEYLLPDRQSYRVPVVMINDISISQALITNFCLDYSCFLPTVMVEFVDTLNQMLSVTSMKDGSIIKIYIGGYGDECYYKPIRQDFIVTEIKKVGGGKQNEGDSIQYRLTGKLNIPIGYKKESWSNFACTSTQELFNVAVQIGLGFATNFEKTTNDKMKWQNTPNTNYLDFIRDITNHACYSPNTFFTSFIDQYYVLNFVECHSLLSHGGSKTDTPAIIYNDSQDVLDSIDKDGNKRFGYKKDEEGKNSPNTLYNNPIQQLTYYYLSNNEYYHNWTNFIEEYVEISNGASSSNDGYRRNVGYTDYNVGDWGINSVIFSIPPIDNLKRVVETQQIEELPELPDNEDDINAEFKDVYIPINLVHATQTVYQTEENNPSAEATKNTTTSQNNATVNPKPANTTTTNADGTTNTDSTEDTSSGDTGAGVAASVDDLSGNESFTFYGSVDTTNYYKLYYFAREQNDFQMNCMKRCGLRVKLQYYNPSITKYSRIWVDIYDKNVTSSISISHIKDKDADEERKKFQELHNKDIINIKGEGIIDETLITKIFDVDEDGNAPKIKNSRGKAKYNRGLSGWYVVTEIKYIYSRGKVRLNTILTLNRIEKTPLFKKEYIIAKNAISKYSADNVIDKLVKSNDDVSYASNNASEESSSGDSTPANDENQNTENAQTTTSSTTTTTSSSSSSGVPSSIAKPSTSTKTVDELMKGISATSSFTSTFGTWNSGNQFNLLQK